MHQSLGRRLAAALALAVVLVAVGAWVVDLTAHDDKPSAAATPAGAQAITISDFTFDPPTLTVKVGDTIAVTNQDDAEHTITSGTRSDPTGVFDEDLQGGQSASFQVQQAGEFTYFCAIHPGMRGTLEVAG